MKQCSFHPSSPVIRLQDSGYVGSPAYRINRQLCPVVFAWWTTTPMERQGKRVHIEVFERLRFSTEVTRVGTGGATACRVPTALFPMSLREIRNFAGSRTALANLPAGYEWQGPCLVEDVSLTQDELDAFSRQQSSAFMDLRRLSSTDFGCTSVAELAAKVLATRKVRPVVAAAA